MQQTDNPVPVEMKGLSPEQHKQRSLKLQYDLDNIQHELNWRMEARYKTEQDKRRIAEMNVQMAELGELIHYHRELAGLEKE
jgi:hypothetical protein